MLTDFTKLPNGNLKISLTDEGKEVASEVLAAGQGLDLGEWIEWQVCNGWDWVRPEDIGAPTSAPILSDEALYSDAGELEAVDTVYWYPQYEVYDPAEMLARRGEVIFTRGE